ncbi:hypothetical protein [Chitinivorax sp. B]|uniref:IS1/IS1595 family N-terminal zinc-binding domain-containing protein n=1 Tax=Chitinivorax sp. B TaxID=2502235 RepID=UPI0010F9E5B7|nr:hypothetical protein [Chitinivorax sp. B]
MRTDNPTKIVMPPPLQQVVGRLADADRVIALQLWADEPALRTLVAILHSLHPTTIKLRGCPYCHNRSLRLELDHGLPRAYCRACDKAFSTATGTPFFRIQQKNHPALYGTLLVWWGPWTAYYAWRIAGCSDTKQFADFRRRLLPLFDERSEDEPLVSQPAWRLGFTPAQQGVRCPRCASDQLAYRRRLQANPQIECRACRHFFLLHTQHRHGLPLPADVACPECHSQALIRRFTKPDGRQVYRCRDCWREFVEGNKRPGLKLRPRTPKPPPPPEQGSS